jgi:hypothetical protein
LQRVSATNGHGKLSVEEPDFLIMKNIGGTFNNINICVDSNFSGTLCMKAILFSFSVLFFTIKCQASADTSIANYFNHIIQLINQDNAKELSKLIAYPLKRKNPLPDAEICEDVKDCGLFLELSLKDKLKNKIKLTEIK